jgi:hypothetical protein
MTPALAHALDQIGVIVAPQPKPATPPRIWGGWKPTYKGEECPW